MVENSQENDDLQFLEECQRENAAGTWLNKKKIIYYTNIYLIFSYNIFFIALFNYFQCY